MPGILHVGSVDSDKRLHLGVAEVDRDLSPRAGEIIDEVSKIGEISAIRKADRAAGVERYAVVHLQVIDICSKFEAMPAQGVAEGFLELI